MKKSTNKGHDAVILVGHGAPAKDCPAKLVGRWKALESRRQAIGGAPSEEEKELDQHIRHWPRRPETDPYKVGLERLASHLAAYLGKRRLVVAYNEFCAPSIEEAVNEMVKEGASRITIVSTMLTPGGVHSEQEIPEIIQELRHLYPNVELLYAWPFDLDQVARLLADQVDDSVMPSTMTGSLCSMR
jgi:sirohydrochlorin cobaltochelatase